MAREGLREVLNPSEYMLSGRPVGASGSVITCSIEGTRPLLTEVQALVSHTGYPYPKRQATGTDTNRVSLLLAVLEKRLGLHMSDMDVYVNLAGGVRQTEPALDLGIIVAVLSSYKNRPIDEKTMVFGEVGLSGEVRSVTMAESRVMEAYKMGFRTCIMPAGNTRKLKVPEDMKLIGIKGLQQVMDYI
jgi:DNA repair protein RadA/Sms